MSIFVVICSVGACGSDPSSDRSDAATEVPRECPADMMTGDICVDADHGSDAPMRGDGATPGTAAAPVKSITHALTLVGRDGPGRTVYVLSGTYDVFNGEVLPIDVPTGITISGVAPVGAPELDVASAAGAPVARIMGEGSVIAMHPGSTLEHSVVIAQGVAADGGVVVDGGSFGITLDDVYVHGTLTAAFRVNSGVVTLRTSQIGPQAKLPTGASVVASDSVFFVEQIAPDGPATSLYGDLTLTNCTFAFRGGGSFYVAGRVTGKNLNIVGATQQVDFPDNNFRFDVGQQPFDAPNLTVRGVHFIIDDANHLRVSGLAASNSLLGCGTCAFDTGSFEATRVDASRSLAISGSTLTGSIASVWRLTNQTTLRIRGTAIRDGSQIRLAGLCAANLGTASDPGNNTFSGSPHQDANPLYVTFLYLRDLQRNIDAAGNTWLPDDSGADASGHFAAGLAVSDAIMGNNIAKKAGIQIQF